MLGARDRLALARGGGASNTVVPLEIIYSASGGELSTISTEHGLYG